MTYYAIMIDTDSYAGNFEREMASFCTGLKFPRSKEYVDPENTPHTDWWEAHTYEARDAWDEKEEGVHCWQTPGWSNDGWGNETRLTEGQEMKWPAFMSVAIFCGEEPPVEVFEAVVERSKLFSDFHVALRERRYPSIPLKPITVENFRLVRFDATTTSQEVQIPRSGGGTVDTPS